MAKNEKAKNWVNRIVSIVIGGGLMFLVMNYGVTAKIRKDFDEYKYEAAGLLSDAKAYVEDKDYYRAKETLNTLFEKRPGSNEAVEGKKLLTQMETEQKELDTKWDAAVGRIREEWAKTMALQLREQLKEKAGTEKEELERDMNNRLDREWERVKEEIREEWEK